MNVNISNKKNVYLFDREKDEYFKHFLEAFARLNNFMTPNQIRQLKKELQLEGDNFIEEKYLQAACETAICASIAEMFPQYFCYEPKINPPKDVDCSFINNGMKFNVEIKCADFSDQKETDKLGGFKLATLGRIENFDKVHKKMLNHLSSPFGNPAGNLASLSIKKNMDNKLKDYLVSAHNKFSLNTGQNELNVLAVCCDNKLDMQRWFSYMYANEGLFTENTFHPHEKFRNVDVVILTNLFHRHYLHWSKDKVKNHWNFSLAFNLVCSNPFRRECKEIIICRLSDSIPNFSKELSNYKVEGGFDEMRIPHFVRNQFLNNGEYYFQEDDN